MFGVLAHLPSCIAISKLAKEIQIMDSIGDGLTFFNSIKIFDDSSSLSILARSPPE